MLLRKTIDVYSENRMKPFNAVCEQNVTVVNIEVSVAYSYHCDLDG
jgi:hypothetical protein